MREMRNVSFPTVYSTGSDCDESNASGQKVIKVAATTNFGSGDRVILGRGGERKEEGIIDSVSAGVSITLLTNLAYNHTVTQEQTLDQESAAAQKKVYITATANLLPGETVVISAGETEEETGVIDTVNTDDYITLVDVLANTHAVSRKCKHTAPAGISVVEVCMASLSTVLYKGSHKIMAIFLSSDWATAAITFAGCNTYDGTYNQVVKAVDIAEVTVASLAHSKVVGLDGVVKQALEGIPYLKLRSGTLASPVDQGISGGTLIRIVLGK